MMVLVSLLSGLFSKVIPGLLQPILTCAAIMHQVPSGYSRISKKTQCDSKMLFTLHQCSIYIVLKALTSEQKKEVCSRGEVKPNLFAHEISDPRICTMI